MKPGRGTTPALTDRDCLAAMIASGLSTKEIAERVGRSTTVVCDWAHRHRLALPQHSRRPPDPPLLRDVEWLRREYHERERSLEDMASEIGRPRMVLSRRFREYGIPIRQHTYPQLRDAGWLEDQFAAGRSLRTIADAVGCSVSAVRLAADSMGVSRPRRSRTDRPSVDELRRVWADRGAIRDLARRYHRCDVTIAAWLDEAGIERRSRTERPSVDELRRVWADTEAIRQLARRYHRCDATIAAWLDEAGIERKRRQPTA